MKKICMMLLLLCLAMPLQGCGSSSEEKSIKAKNESEQKEFMQVIVDGTLKLYALDNFSTFTKSTYNMLTCDGDKVVVQDIEQTMEGKYSVKENKYRSEMETINKSNNQKDKTIINYKDGKQYLTYVVNGKEEQGGVNPYDYFQGQKDYINSYISETLPTVKEVYKIEDKDETTIRLVHDEKELNKSYESKDSLKVNDGACMLSKREVKSSEEEYTINKDGMLTHYEYNMINIYDDKEYKRKGTMDYSNFNSTKDIKLDVSEENIDLENQINNRGNVDIPVYTLDKFQKVGEVMANHEGWTVEFSIVMTEKLTDPNYITKIDNGDDSSIAINVITSDKRNGLCLVESGTNEPIEVYPDHDICGHSEYNIYHAIINLKTPRLISKDEVRQLINFLPLTTKQLKSIKGIYQTTKTYSDTYSSLNDK